MKHNFHPLNIIVQSAYYIVYFFVQGWVNTNLLKKIEFIEVCIIIKASSYLFLLTHIIHHRKAIKDNCDKRQNDERKETAIFDQERSH